MWIRSGDIRDQSRKLSEIAPNFALRNFKGRVFPKVAYRNKILSYLYWKKSNVSVFHVHMYSSCCVKRCISHCMRPAGLRSSRLNIPHAEMNCAVKIARKKYLSGNNRAETNSTEKHRAEINGALSQPDLFTTPLSFDAPSSGNPREYPHKPYIARK